MKKSTRPWRNCHLVYLTKSRVTTNLRFPGQLNAECDVSVSKLLGFETFPFFGMVSDSVSKKFGIGKSFGFGFVQILGILEDISVLKCFGFKTLPFSGGFGFGIKKNWYRKKYRFQYRQNLVSEKVSDSVL